MVSRYKALFRAKGFRLGVRGFQGVGSGRLRLRHCIEGLDGGHKVFGFGVQTLYIYISYTLNPKPYWG